MVCKFQMEKLVDQRNVYVSDDCRFCCYCLLWSAGFNPLGEFLTSSKTLISLISRPAFKEWMLESFHWKAKNVGILVEIANTWLIGVLGLVFYFWSFLLFWKQIKIHLGTEVILSRLHSNIWRIELQDWANRQCTISSFCVHSFLYILDTCTCKRHVKEIHTRVLSCCVFLFACILDPVYSNQVLPWNYFHWT